MTAAPTLDYGRVLARFGSSARWTDLPREVQERARDRVLDALSTAAGSAAVRVAPFVAAASAFGDPAGRPAEATMIGIASPIDAERAAFVNGVGIHSLLYEDISLKSSDHPGAVIVPAALATAELRGADRDLFFTAVVVGYEVQLALGEYARATMDRGFRTTSVYGAVGAAAAAAVVLGLGEDEFAQALALGANAAAGLMEPWAHGTMEPFLHAGSAAQAGMTAARLAAAGAQAAPTTFGGRNGYVWAYSGLRDAAFPQPGQPWQIMDISCKPYPISGAKTTGVDSALELVADGLDATQIVSVDAYLPAGAVAPPGGDRPGPYDNVTQAQDAAQYCVAAALCGKPMTELPTYFEQFDDAQVANLTHRIKLFGEPGRVLGRIVVHLADGTTRESEVDRRDRQVPSVETMSAKLVALAPGVWSPETASAITTWVVGADEPAVSVLSARLRDVNG